MLTLKDGFESLPYGALYNCSMLKEIVFPSSLYMVGERALYGCAGLTDIYCKGAEPSSAYSNTFEGVRVNSCKLHVPYNSSDMYRRSTGWKDFYYIEEEAPITISVVKNIENAGVIYGLQEYQAGDEAELQAVANSGYVFSGWTENGVIVSTEDIYVFTVEGDRELIAVFTPVSGSNDITATPSAHEVSFTWQAEEGGGRLPPRRFHRRRHDRTGRDHLLRCGRTSGENAWHRHADSYHRWTGSFHGLLFIV